MIDIIGIKSDRGEKSHHVLGKLPAGEEKLSPLNFFDILQQQTTEGARGMSPEFDAGNLPRPESFAPVNQPWETPRKEVRDQTDQPSRNFGDSVIEKKNATPEKENKQEINANDQQHKSAEIEKKPASLRDKEVHAENKTKTTVKETKNRRTSEDIEFINDKLQNVFQAFMKLTIGRQSDNETHFKTMGESLKQLKENPGANILKEMLVTLKAIMQKITHEGQSGRNPALVKNIAENARDLVERLSGRNKNDAPRPGMSRDANLPMIARDVMLKLEQIIESLSASEGKNGTGENSANNNAMNIHMLKNFSHSKMSESVDSGQAKQPLFREQLDKVLEHAKIAVKDNRNATLSMKLSPPELGNVNVKLGLEQGVLSGSFMVENNDARDIILQNITQLKNELSDAGIQVGEFNVNVNDQWRGFFNSSEGTTAHPSGQAAAVPEVDAVYSANSRNSHNGLINMII